MFTGIIRGVGQIIEQADIGGDRRLTIAVQDVRLPTLHEGDSVAVNGVCLTVIEAGEQRISADLSLETLDVTTFGELTVGASVNLEPALRLGEPLDGHLLTGHVDGIGHVTDIRRSGRSAVIQFKVPEDLAPYIARKGAVAIDGVSLTVNAAVQATFEVNIIPHTQEKTIMTRYESGTAVNIEVDLIARYLERLMASRDTSTGVSLELLQKHGYTSQH
ncbi:MAG: riboflavin synthase [Gammaproteobacteria bacterium]|nr:riboflavin synthase [Gammaproteobacteria bacterium]MCZ6585644.1 riboflavin synthase [Gammaproteobacteria bacterium]TDJ44897.1 MAG: riboflavin synthase [Gammaproteobacteria bacterium]